MVACELLVMACLWDLVPQPGIKAGAPALGAQSLTHWTTREVPGCYFFNSHKTQQILFHSNLIFKLYKVNTCQQFLHLLEGGNKMTLYTIMRINYEHLYHTFTTGVILPFFNTTAGEFRPSVGLPEGNWSPQQCSS